ncbi:MAG: HDOD domain-containing protein [Sulfurovum sp.]|nr:HDOD domain-containing protein [Sulfurovum sp.]
MARYQDFSTIVSSMGDLPPSPLVASKLLELLRKPETSVRELVTTLSLDPAVSARVLKMANSVYYNQQRQVTTVERAIIITGQNTLRNMVFDSSLRNAKRTYGLLERRLWENSLASAVSCRLIARSAGGYDPEEAYLAGLLHHVGKTVMINRDKNRYRDVQRVVDAGEGELIDVERGLFSFSHGMVGAALLDHWNFPDALISATHHHHDFEGLADDEPEMYTLCSIINLADGFCRYFGFGYPHPDREIELPLLPGALALELNPIEIDVLLPQVEEAFSRERGLFLS